MNKSWKELTKSDLAQLVAKMSGLEIADEFGITNSVVYYKLRQLGLGGHEFRHKRRRFDPPKAELQRIYQSMSMAKIAEHYGVGETVVFKRLKEHGIGGISRADRLTGKPKSLEHRLSMSRSRLASGSNQGPRNGNWKGGISTENKRGRSRAEYFKWKNLVFANAEWKCAKCGLEQGSICKCCGHRSLLHAHHIVGFMEAPERRYDPTNGIALCERCHRQEHHRQSRELLENLTP